MNLLPLEEACWLRVSSFEANARELWANVVTAHDRDDRHGVLILIGSEIHYEHTDVLDYVAARLLLNSKERPETIIVLVPQRLLGTSKAAALASVGTVHILAFEDVHRIPATLLESINLPPATVRTDFVSAVWRDVLTRPASREDRHAIANRAGARLLARAMEKRHRDAPAPPLPLEHVLECLELAPPNHQVATPWLTSGEWQPFVRRIVLIDDMADEGWADVLRAAFGSQEVTVCRDPVRERCFGGRTLLEALQANVAARVHAGGTQSRFEFVDQRVDDRGDLLFIDLRLFGDRTDVEQRFFSDLLNLGQQLADAGDWLSNEPDELKRLSDGLSTPSEDFRRSTLYDVALTLLPRLIATLDPSLPIVTFSSTQSWRVSESLNRYHNVISSFRKPWLFSPASDVIDEARSQFQQAARVWAPLTRVRTFLREVTRQTLPSDKVRRFLDVYIDESGDVGTGRAFAVGGIAFAYNMDEAETLVSLLHEQKLLWGDDERSPNAVDITIPKKPDADREEEVIKLIHGALATPPPLDIVVIAFGTLSRGPFTRAFKTPLPLDSYDGAYHQMLASILELLLFDVSAGMDIEYLRVHAETRSATLRDPKLEDIAIRDFGLVVQQGREGLKYESFDTNMMLPLVQALAANRGQRTGWQLDRARGVSLGTRKARVVGRDPRRLPNQLHYIADWIPRWVASSRVPTGTETWFKQGFIEPFDECFALLLESGRAASRGDFATALHAFYRFRQQRGGTVPLWAARNAARWATSIGGDAVSELARRIATEA